MKIVVAPDSYKGSLSATEVANAIENGILAVFPYAEVIKVPIADGGEGTTEALVIATGGKIMRTKVQGPLGDMVDSYWGLLGDQKTAVIEMAAASGLALVPQQKRNPLITTTYGTGQLIRAALDWGIRRLIIGIGGSATNDGGTGMANALGVKFLDNKGEEVPHGGAGLINLNRIDLSGLDARLEETDISIACDVANPLCGELGASAVYGPQKGATPEMVAELDRALNHYVKIAQEATGKVVADIPGAGAAGGLGAGFLLFTNGHLRPGIDIVLEATNFLEKVQGANLVITGEGRTDFQTAFGKAPIGIAKIAQKLNVPTVCLSGGLGSGAENVLDHGISALMSIVPYPMSLEECIASGSDLVTNATVRMCRLMNIKIMN